jgi:endonuclease-3
LKTKKEVIEVVKILKKTYPDAKCSLDFETPFELGIAVALSAQCTDERVNKVTKILFSEYKEPKDFVDIEIEKLEELIHSCGFYKNKAKNIKAYAEDVLNKYGGELPKDIEKLMSLSGIGRKSANVIMLEAFGEANGIAVDTHCKRVSSRLGLSKEPDPNKIEKDLLKLIPTKYYKDVNHVFIWHGREICESRNPKCERCPVAQYCEDYMLQKKNHRN